MFLKLPTKFPLICLSLISIFLLLTAFGCKPTADDAAKIEPFTLSYWQVWQNSVDMSGLIEEYQKLYPYVKIDFRNLRFEEYEQELLKAWAEDRGPDIFSLPHDWIGMYEKVIVSSPKSVRVKRVVMREPGIGELEPKVDQIFDEDTPLVDANAIKRNYYPVVAFDVLRDSPDATPRALGEDRRLVMALPLYIDNLALYYNIDLLEDKDILAIPATWEQFQKDVMTLTRLSGENGIAVAGTAMGTANNVIRPTDILVTLMLQTGVQMIDFERGEAVFHRAIRETDGYNAGLEALRFYLEFSDPDKKVYTWNKEMGPALELFKQGKLAYLFGYSYNLPEIRGSRVNFGVAPVPIPKEAIGQITVANYWVEAVAKKSAHQEQAWHFLNWLSKPENLLKLQNASLKVSPLKEQATEITDQQLKVFASQAPQAQSWYRGANTPAAEKALLEMITAGEADREKINSALQNAAQQINSTL